MKPVDSQISERILLSAITTCLSHYINETDPYTLFNGLLNTLLEITDSEYGFIGEVFNLEQGTPYLKSYATTSISWNEDMQNIDSARKRKGLLFSTLNTQCCAVLKTGELVISNQPTTDHRSCSSLPEGHPPLKSFMEIPFYGAGKLLGIMGIANRKNGYLKLLAETLQPFLITCSNLILAYRNNIKHQQISTELRIYKESLTALKQSMPLGFGYIFRNSPPELLQSGDPVLLTHKELTALLI